MKFRRDAASAQIGEARLFRRRRRERVLLSVENQDRRRIRGDRAPRQPLVRRVVQNPVERDHAADARAEPRARQVQRAPSAEAKPDDASDAAALRLRLERAHARGDALRGRAPVAPERPRTPFRASRRRTRTRVDRTCRARRRRIPGSRARRRSFSRTPLPGLSRCGARPRRRDRPPPVPVAPRFRVSSTARASKEAYPRRGTSSSAYSRSRDAIDEETRARSAPHGSWDTGTPASNTRASRRRRRRRQLPEGGSGRTRGPGGAGRVRGRNAATLADVVVVVVAARIRFCRRWRTFFAAVDEARRI